MCWNTIYENAKSRRPISGTTRQSLSRYSARHARSENPRSACRRLPHHFSADIDRIDLAEKFGQRAGDPPGAAADFEHAHRFGILALADVRRSVRTCCFHGDFAGAVEVFFGPSSWPVPRNTCAFSRARSSQSRRILRSCLLICHKLIWYIVVVQTRGRLAQLGERCVRNAEVGGSTPPVVHQSHPSQNLDPSSDLVRSVFDHAIARFQIPHHFDQVAIGVAFPHIRPTRLSHRGCG